MRLDAQPISDHRLRRFHRWAMLWLRWFAAFLDAASAFAPLSSQAQTIAHRWLDYIERAVTDIVMIRAAKCVRPLRQKRYLTDRGGIRLPMRRTILGGAIRRGLYNKDLYARVAALSQSLEALIVRLVRRLPRGLTRRRGGVTREATRLTLASGYVCDVPGADTS